MKTKSAKDLPYLPPPKPSDDDVMRRLGWYEIESFLVSSHAAHPAAARYNYPEWLTRAWEQKSKCVFEDAERTARVVKLDERFFQRLENVGNVSLSATWRGFIIGAIDSASDRIAPGRQKCRERHLKQTITSAVRLQALLREELITEGPLGASQFDCELISILDDLIELKRSTLQVTKGPRCRPTKCSRVGLEITDLYEALGGDVIFHKKDGKTYTGSISDFLSVVWEVLPKGVRPNSAQTFIHYAKKARIERRNVRAQFNIDRFG